MKEGFCLGAPLLGGLVAEIAYIVVLRRASRSYAVAVEEHFPSVDLVRR